MDREMLATQLILDEGMRLIPYHDSRGCLTVGVGHLVLAQDQLISHHPITPGRATSFLDQDISRALQGCYMLWPDFADLPEEAQQVLANMAFQLGYPRLRTFHHLVAAVMAQHWAAAGVAMRTSLWYRQTPGRAERLARRMEAIDLQDTNAVSTA